MVDRHVSVGDVSAGGEGAKRSWSAKELGRKVRH